jgi:RNase P subunit RPR2
MSNTRIILWDIETLPDLKQALKYWPQLSNYPGQTLRAQINSIACVGWKELGSRKTNCIAAWNYSRWRKDVNDDTQVLKAIYSVLKDADVIVTHNGKRFDWKFLQTRLLVKLGLHLPKLIHIDTCNESSKALFAFNNRLNTLADLFSVRKKMDHEGWDLWVKTHHKEKRAQNKMAAYCKQDVNVLEDIFKVMRPLITSLPNQNQFFKGTVCPNCGSPKMTSQGVRITREKKYQRFQCQACGAWAQLNPAGLKSA